MSANVTVITAVWHAQQDKMALLRGHMANLDRQTVEHERIYVFDAGDAPPKWLAGTVISAREPLTIYQAWNLALSLVQTPLVMNLNLDDRLAVDAIAHLTAKIASDPEIFLVGGDWKVCESAAATDAIDAAYPIDRLPVTTEWPPAPGVEARLGSGEAKMYGPACLWRMAAHLSLPRYPYRFSDGTLIEVIGDAVWWRLLKRRLNKQLARVPLVIGNYRSWPQVQAEFTRPRDAEHRKSGVMLL